MNSERTAKRVCIKFFAIALIGILIFSFGVWNFEEVKGETKSGYIPHSPIYINGNSQFTSANGVSSGDGTEGNPYIIEGWDINASSQNGIDIRNTDAYFVIKNVYVHDGFSDDGNGSNDYVGITLSDVKNGKIAKSEVKNNDYGIRLYSSSNNTISGNNVYSNNIHGISLDFSSNNNIINNTIFSNGDEGISLYKSSNNSIANNSIYSNSMFGFYLYESSNNTMKNNDIYANHGNGILLVANSYDNIMSSNNIHENNYSGIRIYESSRNIVVNNNLYRNNGDGISLEGGTSQYVIPRDISTSNNTITKNNIFENDYDGVHLYSSTNNTITYNNISFNNYFGISLYDLSKDNVISDNEISNNKRGIFISWCFVSRNKITNNNIYFNSDFGIDILYSSNNIITNNDIYFNNYYGIELWNSPNNTIYLNNFMENTIQAFDNTNNFFDNGTIGNYWSDYSGEDNNSDGIGDTPYIIDNDSKDNYPLMYPINFTYIPQKPDLFPSSISLSPSPIENQQTTISSLIKNLGNANANNFSVSLIIDNQTIENKTISLSANSSLQISFNWIVQNGNHTIKIIIDKENKIKELNETNNEITSSISVFPDLTPEIYFSHQNILEGQNITFIIKIKNVGNGYGWFSEENWNWNLVLYIDDEKFYFPIFPIANDGDLIYNSTIYPYIDPNEIRTFYFNWIATKGNHTIKVVVDENNTNYELNENNNSAIIYLNVNENAKSYGNSFYMNFFIIIGIAFLVAIVRKLRIKTIANK